MGPHRTAVFGWFASILFLALVCAVVAIASPRTSHAQAPTACGASPDGGATTFTSADGSAVQQAVDAASVGDVIRIAGYCSGVQARAGTNQVVYISQTLTLQGGYTFTNWMTPDPSANPTTLDAAFSGRVAFVSGADATIADLTLADGAAFGPGDAGYGGGVYSGQSLTLTGVTLLENRATTAGGGVYLPGTAHVTGGRFYHNMASTGTGGGLHAGQLSLNGTDFIYNIGSTSGGGAYVAGAATVSDAYFERNRVQATGGGLYAGGAVTLTEAVFVNNYAAVGGGGLAVDGPATLFGGRFERNEGGSYGGGVNAMYPLQAVSTEFISNTAEYGGGLQAFSATLDQSRFEGNVATADGGGLFVWSGADVTGARFVRNEAVTGGGAYLSDGGARFVNALFVENESTGASGAALFCYAPGSFSGATEVLFSTIVGPANSGGPALAAGDRTLGVTDTIVSGYSYPIGATGAAVAGEDYNLFFDTGTSSGAVSSGAHSATGDPAFTNPATLDYHLAAGSKAIDLGTDAGVYTDLDGAVRPRGAGFDVGAYESPFAPDVTIHKSAAPAIVLVGGAVTYTLVFSNEGSGLARGVVITDLVPPELTGVQIASSGATITQTGSAAFIWQVADLPSGTGGIITLTGAIRADVPPGTVFTNTAAIAAAGAVTPTHPIDAVAVLVPLRQFLPNLARRAPSW